MGKFGVKRDMIREKILKILEKMDLKNFLRIYVPFWCFWTHYKSKRKWYVYAVTVKLKFVIFPKSWPWRKYQAYSI